LLVLRRGLVLPGEGEFFARVIISFVDMCRRPLLLPLPRGARGERPWMAAALRSEERVGVRGRPRLAVSTKHRFVCRSAPCARPPGGTESTQRCGRAQGALLQGRSGEARSTPHPNPLPAREREPNTALSLRHTRTTPSRHHEEPKNLNAADKDEKYDPSLPPLHDTHAHNQTRQWDRQRRCRSWRRSRIVRSPSQRSLENACCPFQ